MARFRERLLDSARRSGGWLCVGLDPEPETYPDGLQAEDTLEYLLGVVHAVAPHACALKANAAHFEALGDVGHDALHGLVERLPPGLPFILDGKRNDIGSTAQKYAQAAFDVLGADAVTVNPYLGRDGVEPFAAYDDRGVFLLARTSNASARDFQDLDLAVGGRLFEHVTRTAMAWDREWGNLGFVAGATYPEDLRVMRRLCGAGVPLLIPGVGAQGADAATTLAAGRDEAGHFALVNVGRALVGVAKGKDWQGAVRAQAASLARQLR